MAAGFTLSSACGCWPDPTFSGGVFFEVWRNKVPSDVPSSWISRWPLLDFQGHLQVLFFSPSREQDKVLLSSMFDVGMGISSASTKEKSPFVIAVIVHGFCCGLGGLAWCNVNSPWTAAPLRLLVIYKFEPALDCLCGCTSAIRKTRDG